MRLGSRNCTHAALAQGPGAAPGPAWLLQRLPLPLQQRLCGGVGANSRGLRSSATPPASAVAPQSSSGGTSAAETDGLPFALNKPWRPLRYPWGRRLSGVRASDMQVEIDAMLEGSPDLPPGALAPRAPDDAVSASDLEALLRRVQADVGAAVPHVLVAKKARRPRWPLPQLATVSLVLCDDAYIRSLNAAHRGKDAATDVLSFEVPDEPGEVPPPVKLLGDLVISLETAARQAEERG
jgi:hypothetical protein